MNGMLPQLPSKMPSRRSIFTGGLLALVVLFVVAGNVIISLGATADGDILKAIYHLLWAMFILILFRS